MAVFETGKNPAVRVIPANNARGKSFGLQLIKNCVALREFDLAATADRKPQIAIGNGAGIIDRLTDEVPRNTEKGCPARTVGTVRSNRIGGQRIKIFENKPGRARFKGVVLIELVEAVGS